MKRKLIEGAGLRRVFVFLALVGTSCSGDRDGEPDLELTAQGLADGTVGASYLERLAVTGRSADQASWRLVDGELPPGLGLTGQTGPMNAIAGRPAMAGRFDFTIAVTADGSRAEQRFGIVVGNALAIDGSLDGAVEGQPYHRALDAIAGRGQHHTWTVEGLPDGLTATPSGRALTVEGVPPPGRFMVSVSVSDDAGATASRSIEMIVLSSLSITGELAAAREGRSYEAVLNVHGGTGTGYHWSLGSAAPIGIRLVDDGARSVRLLGTLLAGEYVVPIAVSDDSGARAERDLKLDVFAALAIMSFTAPNGRVADPYTVTLTARGGPAPMPEYDWSVESGVLPPGLALTATSGASVAISGTPTAVGTFHFTIAVASGDEQATRDIEIVVGANPPTIVTTQAPDGTFGLSYDVSIDVQSPAGGPAEWRVTSGELPPGLVLAAHTTGPSGRLSGAPRLCGQFAFTLEVTDAGGSDTVDLRVAVTRQDRLEIAATRWPRARVGEPYAVSAAALNAHGHVTWSLAGGELPAGLALDAATGSLSGTPTQAGFQRLLLQAVDDDGRTATRELALGVNRDRSFVVAARSQTFSGPQTVTVREVTGRRAGTLTDVTGALSGYASPEAFSPGGTWANVRANDGQSLYLVDLRGDQPAAIRMTGALRRDRSGLVRFSPDDAFVAWAIESPPGSFQLTWTITDLRGPVPAFVTSIAQGDDAEWSPDGRELFVVDSARTAIRIWNGTTVRTVPLPAPLREFTTLWAPDSQALVLTAYGDGGRTYLLPLDEPSLPLPLTPRALLLNGNFMELSPDGAIVLVSDTFSGNPTTHQLAIDLRGAQPAQAVEIATGQDIATSWSPDGRQLAVGYNFFSANGVVSLARLDRDAIGLSAPVPIDLTSTGDLKEWGHWTADSAYFGYASTQGLFELPMRSDGPPRLIVDAVVRRFDWASLSPQRRAYLYGLGRLYFIDLARPDAMAVPVDDDAAAASDWRVVPHLQAAVWYSFAATPRSLMMVDLSAGVPAASTPLIDFAAGIITYIVTP